MSGFFQSLHRFMHRQCLCTRQHRRIVEHKILSHTHAGNKVVALKQALIFVKDHNRATKTCFLIPAFRTEEIKICTAELLRKVKLEVKNTGSPYSAQKRHMFLFHFPDELQKIRVFPQGNGRIVGRYNAAAVFTDGGKPSPTHISDFFVLLPLDIFSHLPHIPSVKSKKNCNIPC